MGDELLSPHFLFLEEHLRTLFFQHAYKYTAMRGKLSPFRSCCHSWTRPRRGAGPHPRCCYAIPKSRKHVEERGGMEERGGLMGWMKARCIRDKERADFMSPRKGEKVGCSQHGTKGHTFCERNTSNMTLEGLRTREIRCHLAWCPKEPTLHDCNGVGEHMKCTIS